MTGLKTYIDTMKEKLSLDDDDMKMLNFVVSKIEEKTTTTAVKPKKSSDNKKEGSSLKDLNDQSLNESNANPASESLDHDEDKENQD